MCLLHLESLYSKTINGVLLGFLLSVKLLVGAFKIEKTLY